MRRTARRAAPALVAGAALVVGAACGGVLGPQVTETISALGPVSCAIDRAAVEDGNYTQASADDLEGFPFAGSPADNLLKPANRVRIFRRRVAELQASQRALARIKPGDDFERDLTAAARRDLRGALVLMRYELRWAPDEPDRPLDPEQIPNELDAMIQTEASQQIRRAFTCDQPPDVLRRRRAYQG